MIGHVFSGIAGFVVGVAVGAMLRETFNLARTGKGSLVTVSRPLARSRTAGVVLVVLALLVNGILGFSLIFTRADVSDQSRKLEELTACQERYNRAQGEALTARDRANRTLTVLEANLWRDLEQSLARTSPGTGEIVATIRTYRTALAKVQRTRAANPYPDPDLCRRLTP
jgi:hypothetical protein